MRGFDFKYLSLNKVNNLGHRHIFQNNFTVDEFGMYGRLEYSDKKSYIMKQLL